MTSVSASQVKTSRGDQWKGKNLILDLHAFAKTFPQYNLYHVHVWKHDLVYAL